MEERSLFGLFGGFIRPARDVGRKLCNSCMAGRERVRECADRMVIFVNGSRAVCHLGDWNV